MSGARRRGPGAGRAGGPAGPSVRSPAVAGGRVHPPGTSMGKQDV